MHLLKGPKLEGVLDMWHLCTVPFDSKKRKDHEFVTLRMSQKTVF